MEHVRVTGQTIAFPELAELMMDPWENLDGTSKAYYEELQAKDERRYMLERMAWEARMEQEGEEHTTATNAQATFRRTRHVAAKPSTASKSEAKNSQQHMEQNI